MLEHYPDQFLPKTKPKPDQNPTSICEKGKNSFLRTPKEHRKKAEPSRKGGFRKNSNKRPPQKKLLRENKKREPSKNLLGSVWFKREFFPFTAQAFSGRLLNPKEREKGRNAERGRVRVGERSEIGGKVVREMF